MPYITVRENKAKWWITVQGLNYNEVRLLSEKLSDQPESHSDKEKMAEFSVPTWMVRRSSGCFHFIFSVYLTLCFLVFLF